MTRSRRTRRPAALVPVVGPVADRATDEAVTRVVAEVAAGRPVVLVEELAGALDGEVCGHLVLAAEHTTPERLAFLVRYTSGFVCVALPDPDADRLDLPAMTAPAGACGTPRSR